MTMQQFRRDIGFWAAVAGLVAVLAAVSIIGVWGWVWLYLLCVAGLFIWAGRDDGRRSPPPLPPGFGLRADGSQKVV
jgi:hypothetical protein